MFLFFNRFKPRPRTWLNTPLLVLLLGLTGTIIPDTYAQELERREARVQVTYLTHLLNYTRWNKDHLPVAGQSPKILVIGAERNGFIASLQYLLSQSDTKIGGISVKTSHVENGNALAELKKGAQVIVLMPDANLKLETIRKHSPSAVVFAFDRELVSQKGVDVSFVSSRNRVRLVLNENYFRRTSPKLSAKIANLKSVIEIIKNS